MPTQKTGYSSMGDGWTRGLAGEGIGYADDHEQSEHRDARLRDQVCDLLCHDKELDASLIDVAVQHGHVTLSGTVASQYMKQHAEDVTSRVAGLHEIQNLLRIPPIH